MFINYLAFLLIDFFFIFERNSKMKSIKLKRKSLNSKTFGLNKPQKLSPKRNEKRHSITNVSFKGLTQNEKLKNEKQSEEISPKKKGNSIEQSKNDKIGLIFRNRSK